MERNLVCLSSNCIDSCIKDAKAITVIVPSENTRTITNEKEIKVFYAKPNILIQNASCIIHEAGEHSTVFPCTTHVWTDIDEKIVRELESVIVNSA